MLGIDVSVASALLLSLASALLCVAYGWSRWNADADGTPTGVDRPASEGSDDPSHENHGT